MHDTSERPESQNCLRSHAAIMRLATVTELLLIAATWRLWFAASAFPQVPFFGWLHDCPVGVLRGISGTFVCGLIVLALSGLRSRSFPGRLPTVLVGGLGLVAVACNQHCLQPWHWLFLLIAATRIVVPHVEFRSAVQRIVPWIYIFAAVSRFGPGIDSGMSRQIVIGLLDFLDLPMIAGRPSSVTMLCVIATLIELLAGICLLWRRLRKIGLLLAVLMHVTLILVLGPLGLQQETGVLIWNGYLACLVIQLWWKPSLHKHQLGIASRAMATFSFVWPALALFGITHNWTGWQVYSPRPESLQLQVRLDAISQLPESLRPHVESPQALQDWSTVRLDRWCLQETNAPMYPQAGFQLSVALAATKQLQNDDDVRGRMNRPETPLWWKRQTDEFLDRTGLSAAAD